MCFGRLKIFLRKNFPRSSFGPKDILFYLLFLSLPFQLGKHFWLKESYIFGLKIDYLSPAFYLQDIFILVLIFLELKETELKKKTFFFLIIVFVLLNILFSEAKTVSVYWWLRFAELFSLGIVIRKNSKTAFNILLSVLPLIVIFESVLGFLQVINKASLGGIFWFFGERNFNIFTPGIARASFLGKVFLRPYATFSHPNSLAGFMVICVVLLMGKDKKGLFDKISLFLGVLLIFLSFSRTAWLNLSIIFLVFLVFRLFDFIKRKTNKLTYSYLLSLVSSLPLFFLFSRTTIDSSSFTVRVKLAESALEIIKRNPFFGIGAGNFVISLSRGEQVWQWLYWLQPVHNVFLLIFSELGLLLAGVFIFFYFRIIFNSSKNQILLACLFSITLTGLFDHYWLTLIQNQIMLSIILSFSYVFSKSPSSGV